MDAEDQNGSFERRRLLVIVSGMVATWVLGGAAAVLFLYTIPGVKVEISNRLAEIALLQPDVKKVQATVDALEKLKQKIVVVENLDRSRVRLNRLLIRIGSVVSAQDGTWLKQLVFSKAKDPKRQRLALHGYAAGINEQEMQKRVSALMNALEAQLVVMDADKKPIENEALRVIFERPVLIESGSAVLSLPAAAGRASRKLACRSFVLELVFDPLPALTSMQPAEKIDDFKFVTAAIKRDPFVCPEK